MKAGERCSILVLGGYGFDNLGDDLILRAALGQLRKTLMDPQITILSNDPEETRTRHKDEDVIFSPEALHRQIAVRLLRPVIKSFRKYELRVPGDTFRRLFLSLIQSKLVVSLGGGYLNDYSTFLTHFRLVELVFLGLFRKRIVLYAHEVGPLRRTTLRLLARLALRFVTYATVRDEPSLEVLSKLGLPKERIALTADESWAYDPKSSMGLVSDSERNGICIATNVMPSEVTANFLRSERIPEPDFEEVDDEILSAIATHVRDLGPRVRRIVFMSMSTGDTKLGLRLQRMLGERYSFEISCDLDSQYCALTRCDLFIGMRLHAIIMAVQMSVRPLAITLLPKVNRVMNDLGLSNYAVQGSPFDARGFGDKLNRILDDLEKAKIHATTGQATQRMRAKAILNAAVVKSIVTQLK